jgi:SnoaL-like protein
VDIWEVTARVEIQQTLTNYGRYVDSGRLDLLAELFTQSCHYDTGDGAPLVDRAAILERGEELKAMFAAAENFGGRVRHHLTPARIDFIEPSRAKATSYFLTVGKSGPDHWGVYRDELVLDAGTWRFARRVVTVEGYSADSPANDRQLSGDKAGDKG